LKSSVVSPRELGLRERNKFQKRQRIRAAARELFSKRGYDAATLRQIAHRAHVGLGTLFNYAQDKRDLVFLIFNEELSAVTDAALKMPEPRQPLLDQLLAISKCHYDYFAKDPMRMVDAALRGLSGPVTVSGQAYNSVMPPMSQLTDDEVANILTYVMGSWANGGGKITKAEVAERRKAKPVATAGH